MSKIEDLISPQMEVQFREEKYMLESGFTLEESPALQMAFGKNQSPETKAKGMRMLLKVIARRLYPKATESQISKIDTKYTSDLLDVFFQMDGSTKEEIEEMKKILEEKK